MSKRLVSIVLPVYNGQKYISQSIESILSQSYDNIELIIVNDCSTDNTLDILNIYAARDARVRIINNDKNLKLPKSLNRGFEEAVGDYFSWTSDDNLYMENAIETMVEQIEENNADMVNADCIFIDKNGKETGTMIRTEPEKLLHGNRVGACFLYSRKIAEKVGEYDPSLFLAEDYDYWARISFCGKIFHINKELYYYRRHDDSLTETKDDLLGIQVAKVLEKHFLRFSYEAKNLSERHRFYSFFLSRLAGNREEYVRIRKMILQLDPSYRLWEWKREIGRKRKIKG